MSKGRDYSADITILVSTSLLPSHPSTAIISHGLTSLREQLHTSPIIIMADGSDDPRYRAYLSNLERQWCDGWYPHVFRIQKHDTHLHQSGMLKPALSAVNTPFILYWEGDWTLLPDVPWGSLCEIIKQGDFNTIKLHANPRISPYYEHMMEGRVMYQEGKCFDRYQDNLPGPAIPIVKTRQWSQNPHLSSTDFYRNTILPLVNTQCEFIENIVHGVVGNSPWEEFKTGIYNPASGDMMRIRHLDGRGTKC